MEEKLCLWTIGIIMTIALIVSHSIDDTIDPNVIRVDNQVYEITARW